MVGPGRLELPTSRLSSARSNQLSYEPGSSREGHESHALKTKMSAKDQVRTLEGSIRKGCVSGGSDRRNETPDQTGVPRIFVVDSLEVIEPL
jgi:hypothetical protein